MADVLQFDVTARLRAQRPRCVGCNREILTTKDRHYVVDNGRECARCHDQRVNGFCQGRTTATDGYMANTTPTF